MCNTELEDQTVGLFAVDSFKHISDAQIAVRRWAQGECLPVSGNKQQVGLGILVAEKTTSRTSRRNNTFKTRHYHSLHHSLKKRDTCRVIQVASGNSCGSLASRCGTSGAASETYNPDPNLCSTLLPKQWVCCSAGSMPDMTPKPQADGTCAIHTIAPGDNCADIAANFGITVDKINEFNSATWGWSGCDQLQPDQVICLSEGNSPMPAPIEGVVCGLQKPGIQKPSGSFDGFDLAKLNQCPLNACCSGWGYCGTTEEFCTESPADTGAPGSRKKDTNGCISNCGMDIVGNDNPPAEFRRVAYFEAFNVDRPCLNMDVSEIPTTTGLTHIHFAFAGITSDFQVKLDDNVKEQFNKFVKLDVPWKKIVSFGGWAESTDADSFQLYKDAVKPANRDKFANAVVAFAQENGLDGVDFDWEYPGATDIPGVPAGWSEEAVDYLKFLTIVKSRLGDKSLSIALPASYWYLKPFPVEKMAKQLDYFIYMTYDLHGQWGKWRIILMSQLLQCVLTGDRLRKPIFQPRLSIWQLPPISRQQNRNLQCALNGHQSRRACVKGNSRCVQLCQKLWDERYLLHRSVV